MRENNTFNVIMKNNFYIRKTKVKTDEPYRIINFIMNSSTNLFEEQWDIFERIVT